MIGWFKKGPPPRHGRLAVWALLALCCAEPGLAAEEVEEFKPTAEQLADYYAVYTNGDVKHLRTVFDRVTAGKKDGETRLLRGFEPYLGRKFIVMSRDPALAGGAQITILFQGKVDALFHAWVYDRGPVANRYELRGFTKAKVPKAKLEGMAVRYRKFLEDPEHAM
jgi:hypothetical protein